MDHCWPVAYSEKSTWREFEQADIIAVFLNANLGDDEKVYMEIPLGFK